MAMHVSGAADGPMMEINTTPLIDVMLVLLIMLIMTLPVMSHAIRLDMPIGGTPQDQPDPVGIWIEFDGTVLWDGAVVADMRELEQRMHLESRKAPQPTLQVRADRRAKYDTVAHVLAIAQRNGMQRIGIEGTP